VGNIIPEIIRLSEKYRDYTAGNLSKLVKIKSLSRKEGEVQRELRVQMEEAGFDDIKTDGLGNVIGKIGTGKRILAIDGHMDTVDIGNPGNWSFDPFGGEIRNGYVHGRGSVDQKGGLASFITSGRILKELGFDKNMTVYFTGSVMEEDCEGLCWKYIIEQDGIRPDFVLITEPTNLNIHTGHRGRIELQVNFNGKSAHGSVPERGENAICMASKAVLEIEKLNEKLMSDLFFGKGSISVTEIKSGGPSLCAVPDYSSIHLDRRLTWGETQESCVREIETIISGVNATIDLLTYSETSYTGMKTNMEKYYPSWRMPEAHKIIKTGISVFNTLFGKKPETGKWNFSTNGIMTKGIYGIPTVGFGPGSEELAHSPDEKILINDLVKASSFYAAFAYAIK
jgi:putative selenium metabolism hydrolase